MFEGLKIDFALLLAKHKMKVRIAALALAFLAGAFFSHAVFAENATVRWAHPTTRTDGTPLPLSEILETEIDWGLCAAGAFPATPAGTVSVAAPATSHTVMNLSYGTWCFRARTEDTGNRVSVNTSVVQTIILAPPNPPTLSSTITLAYDLNGINRRGRAVLGQVVGTIDLGTACMPGVIRTNKGKFYRVDHSQVELTREPRSTDIVTKCTWT